MTSDHLQTAAILNVTKKLQNDTDKELLLISDRFYPENFLVNSLVRNWDDMGIQVDVLSQIPSYPHDRRYPGFSRRYREKLSPRVSVRRTQTTLGYSRSRTLKIIGYLMFALRASFVAFREYSHHRRLFVYHTGPLTQAIPVVLLKMLGKCERAVIWTQDVWPDAVHAYGFPRTGPGAGLLELFVRWIYGYFDHILVSSPGFVERLRNKVPLDRPVRFVPQWVPEEFEADEEPGFDPEQVDAKTKFVFTGNIGSMQNLDLVLDAFCEISNEDAVLYIVGDGNQRKRLEEKTRLRGQTNVRFVGSYPVSRIRRTIQACDFSIFSLFDDKSISMTIPAKFVAYLSAQRPIVCISKGEVGKMVERNEIGLVADPKDTASIVRVIEQAVASQSSERAEWSRRMEALQKQRFERRTSIETITNAIFER